MDILGSLSRSAAIRHITTHRETEELERERVSNRDIQLGRPKRLNAVARCSETRA
jgi:hypothetical protein